MTPTYMDNIGGMESAPFTMSDSVPDTELFEYSLIIRALTRAHAYKTIITSPTSPIYPMK